jgi:phosphopantothenoylcysteine decarboxylase/phosphopantothenate--cysteine ligase
MKRAINEVFMLHNKKILVAITGGIAAYKAIDLVSRLRKAGCQVKVMLSDHAAEFVTPLTFKSLTGMDVAQDMFDPTGYIEHITWADWADLVVIAPATGNIIGKVASGIADELVSTTIMATTAPVLFVPAMNIHMYENPIVQQNIHKLSDLGYFFMEPEHGMLACGYRGKGRFPAPAEIVFAIATYVRHERDLAGKTILISTGACREAIDPMRFVTNHSSGKMGLALARAAHLRGAAVQLVAGSITEDIPDYLASTSVVTAAQMHTAITAQFAQADITIMAAAVSDYTPLHPADEKIKKGDNLTLELGRTTDILAELGKSKQPNQLLVGFAAESTDILANATDKLHRKHLDMIIANDLHVAGQGETSCTILQADGSSRTAEGDKFSVAHAILDAIVERL